MTRRRFLKVGAYVSLVAQSGFVPELSASNLAFSTPLKIGYLPITDHLLIIGKSLYSSAFLPVKFNTWSDLAQSLSAGKIDGAFILTPLALKLHRDIKILMATHRNGSGIVLKHGIKSIKNAKIAIPSRFSTHYLLLEKYLDSINLNINDVKLVDMAPPEMVFALRSGGIDGFIVAEPFISFATSLNIGRRVISSYEIHKDHICCVLGFGKKVLESRETEIKNIVFTLLNTAKDIQKDKSSAISLSTKYLGQKKEMIQKVLNEQNIISFENLKITKDELEHVRKDISKQVDLSNIDINEILDSTFIKEYYEQNI